MEKNKYQSYRDELLDSASFQNHMDKHFTTVKHFVWGRNLFSDKPMLLGLGLGVAFSFSALLAGSSITWIKVIGIIGIIGCIITVRYGALYLQGKAENVAAEKIFQHICYEAAIKEYILDKERSKTIDLLRKSRDVEDLNELRDELGSQLDELYENLGYEFPRDHTVRKKVGALLKLKDL